MKTNLEDLSKVIKNYLRYDSLLNNKWEDPNDEEINLKYKTESQRLAKLIFKELRLKDDGTTDTK